ncbi:MAG: ATP-binding protein [Candidatus Thorarchaeota archaeon]
MQCLGEVDTSIKFKSGNKASYGFEIIQEHTLLSVSQKEKAFIMFERGLENSLDIIEGSGIGLTFSKKIIKIHNGRITVDSLVGMGSTFQLWLPKRPSFQKDRLF